MKWWQSRNIIVYNEIINKINLSKEEKENFVKKCDFLFDSLNKLWADYFLYMKTTNNLSDEEKRKGWSDNKAFFELLKTLKDRLEIWQSEELKLFTFFEPKIMNHDTLRKQDYDPYSISSELKKKSQDEHRQLFNAYSRFIESSNDKSLIEHLIKKLAQLLYIVRSNIKHGEKTPKGPDIDKVKRDSEVCKATYPLLDLILEFLFDNPSSRLACYGTLLPSQPNSKVIKFEGTWKDGTIKGEINISNGLPFFKWKTTGDDIPVKIFVSNKLSENIDELDRFEGEGYRRIWIPGQIEKKFTICNIYGGKEYF